MKRAHFSGIMMVLALAVLPFFLGAQEPETKEEKGYLFENKIELPATSVKNQYKSSTCWSFSSISFIESELLRLGKGEFDLSEMFIIWNTYNLKARSYVRWHGNMNFAGGGAFHDVSEIIRHKGIVPESVYAGKLPGEENHIHNEMDEVFKGYVDAVIKNKNGRLSPAWEAGFEGLLNAYLGDYPESFIYEGKEFSPQSFASELGLDMDNYVEIGSYQHHPYWEQFILEVPDNWMMDRIYNVPLEDMMRVIDASLESGYTVAWGADVSEKGFSWRNGVAIVPEADLEDMSGTERERWESLSAREREKMLYSFDKPGKEKVITAEFRQEAFDNFETTDDHGMHITGTAVDQDGNQYYIVKNSWGTSGNDYEGYFYASKAYVAYKTIDIWVHKDAVPKDIRKKLGF